MKMMRLGIALTVVNLALLIFLLAELHPLRAQPSPAPVLRGRALQIVDEHGRVRAEIVIHEPTTIGAKTYPETVLFRMSDQHLAPMVKVTASEEGAALGLTGKGGRAQVIRP